MRCQFGGISLFAQILKFLCNNTFRKSKSFIIRRWKKVTNIFSLASYSNSLPKNICLNLGKCGEKSIGLQMYFFAFALLFLSIAGASVLKTHEITYYSICSILSPILYKFLIKYKLFTIIKLIWTHLNWLLIQIHQVLAIFTKIITLSWLYKTSLKFIYFTGFHTNF